MNASDIPEGERIDIEDTELDVPDLPDPWEWRMANHNGFGKVNVFFGHSVYEVGGWLGEIDNYRNSDGDEMWGLHIRTIEALPSHRDKETIPAECAETSVEFGSLEAAIEATPGHIKTHYEYEEAN